MNRIIVSSAASFKYEKTMYLWEWNLAVAMVFSFDIWISMI